MIRFLLKGLLRDSSRSVLPLTVVAIGVTLTVVLQSWLGGFIGDMISSNANFTTGHVRIMTMGYAENENQMPNDLALVETDALLRGLRKENLQMEWVSRIHFGGLLDVPDEYGETKSQGPAVGLAFDMLSPESRELDTLNIRNSLVRGRLPERRGEILISDEFAEKLGIAPGDTATLLGSTMYGSMAMQNYVISGTVRFGISAMDRGAMLMDLSDARLVLDMENAAGEILGFFADGQYHEEEATRLAEGFNAGAEGPMDELTPVMRTLAEQNGLGEYLALARYMVGILSLIFVAAMSVVLWNVGLIGGLRRYGEIGLRLAFGEEKGHVYRSVIAESLLIGVGGSAIGTAVGLAAAWYLQVHGIDLTPFLGKSSMMISSVARAKISAQTFYVGFIPGTLSTVLGAALSGVGIYRRQTAQLFKELEV